MNDFDLTLFAPRTNRLHHNVAHRTRRVYDRLAGVYPISSMFFHAKAHRALLAETAIRDGSRVLEVATGSGEMFRRLVRANPNGLTTGLDLSPNMAARTLGRVRRRHPLSSAYCQAVDARHMPFQNETFDTLVSCYLLELLGADALECTLAEFHRVLRPGATLSLVLIGRNSETFNYLYRIGRRMAPAFWGPQLDHQMPLILEAHGFRVTTDRHVRQTGYPSRILVARKR